MLPQLRRYLAKIHWKWQNSLCHTHVGTAGVPRALLLLIHFWQQLFTSRCAHLSKQHFVVSSNTRVLIYSDNALKIYLLGNQVYIMHIGCCLPYADHQLKAWTVESPTLLITDIVFNVAMLHNCRHLISIASITKVNQSVVLMMLCC